MNDVVSGTITVLTGIISVAILAVILSNKASTVGVIGAAGKAFAGSLQAATNPFSGGGSSLLNASFSPNGVGDNNYF